MKIMCMLLCIHDYASLLHCDSSDFSATVEIYLSISSYKVELHTNIHERKRLSKDTTDLYFKCALGLIYQSIMAVKRVVYHRSPGKSASLVAPNPCLYIFYQ